LSIGSEFFNQQPLLSASRLQDIGSLAEQASNWRAAASPAPAFSPVTRITAITQNRSHSSAALT
jgi:hypothetical protein